MDNAVELYRIRRKKRLDAREWHEGDRLRDEKGRFAPTGTSDIPDKIKKVMEKSYFDKPKKLDEMSKVFGRMKVGTTFHVKDDRGVLHRFKKVDKGDDGWEVRIKTKDGWSQPERTKRSIMGAKILASQKDK